MDNNQAIELLRQAVMLDTVGGNESALARLLAAELRKADIECRLIEYAPGREQLMAEIRGTSAGSYGKTLAFCGHMDVVPVGEVKWQHKPFAADILKGRLYGRGACDMKGGLVAIAATMIRLKQQGCPFNGGLKFMATIGEETAALGAQRLVQEGMANNIDAMVIGEPTGLQVMNGHKGALWLRLTTTGRTAHGALPQQGINAVDGMLMLLDGFAQSFHLDKQKHQSMGRPTCSLNGISGGSGTNVVPDKCVAELDIRTLPGMDHADMVSRAEKWLKRRAGRMDGLGVQLEVINDLQPVYTDAEQRIVKVCLAASKLMGGSGEPCAMPGYTDAARFAQAEQAFPVVIIGPGNLQQAHQPDEFISLDEFTAAQELYAIIAMDYLT